VDRLGNAIARLYERHADILPGGPERARAAATARAVLVLPGPPDRWPFAPGIEFVDHRTVGLGSVHGAEAVRRGVRALLDLTDDFATRVDDILALRSDALLERGTHSGTDRASGGAFERHLCHLWILGADGLIARGEQLVREREPRCGVRCRLFRERGIRLGRSRWREPTRAHRHVRPRPSGRRRRPPVRTLRRASPRRRRARPRRGDGALGRGAAGTARPLAVR